MGNRGEQGHVIVNLMMPTVGERSMDVFGWSIMAVCFEPPRLVGHLQEQGRRAHGHAHRLLEDDA